MSITFVQGAVRKGSVNGAGQVDPGDCRFRDVIASRIQQELTASEPIRRMLGGQAVYRFDHVPDNIWEYAPCLTVSHFSSDPALAPTNLRFDEVDTVISLWHQSEELRPLEPYEPTVQSFLDIVEGVLARCVTLDVTLQATGDVVQLTTGGFMVSRPNIPVQAPDQILIAREMIFRHQVSSDAASGLIKNLVNTGVQTP